MVRATGLDCHFLFAEMYSVAAIQLAASRCPPDICIWMGSSPTIQNIKQAGEAEASPAYLVRMTGLEPACSRVGT